ncbi:hypothetical protein TPAR_08406 [Tolypocladium paradoxum]|uniref:Uncharacterized protein n=1 Tax=Tolypocladium paradoxum TaxID=94208 RepID=A0A2S4KMG0_9HYPO|nr:hypothetical protein TPAR_08406 [Tolypocladium paradoxum]
MRGYTQED